MKDYNYKNDLIDVLKLLDINEISKFFNVIKNPFESGGKLIVNTLHIFKGKYNYFTFHI